MGPGIMKPQLNRSTALAMLASILLLAGCGGSGADGGEPGATAPGASAPETAASGAAPAATGTQDKPGKKPAASSAAPAPSAFGTNVLAYPDDFQMILLSYRLTDRDPPLAVWAGEQRDVKYADEFSKAGKLDAETARLQDIYASTEGVGIIQIRLTSQISQYDTSRGGYYLTAFSPGNQISFNSGESVSLQLNNMADAFFWPVDAARAQEILEHTNRSINIDTKIRITGAQRRSNGVVIQGVIEDYGIYSTRYNDERQFETFSLD